MRPENQIVSPLRYPGSKAALTDYIAAVIEANLLSGCTIYEPYAGSAAVALEMVSRGFAQRAVLVERDPLVYCFWHCVFNETEAFINDIFELDISIDTWNDFQLYRTASNLDEYTTLELGLAGLFFNRTNFSGILGAGPIGGIDQNSKYKINCRFNKKRIIEQIITIALLKEQVTVVFGDAIEYLITNSRDIENSFSFLYIDPPYYGQGKKLYRYWYEDENHKQLANYLINLEVPWLVSYDDHPKIREYYSSSTIQKLFIDYTARVSRKGEELLISNILIPPPEYKDSRTEILNSDSLQDNLYVCI